MHDIELFKAADGLLFWAGKEPFILRGGLYSPEVGALYIMTDNGEQECKVTVNMVSEVLDHDEFFTKVEEMTGIVGTALLRLGLFVRTDRVISSGYVKEYAQAWRFAPCGQPAHAGSYGYAVKCPTCRARWKDEFEKGVETTLARDAVERLKGEHIGEWP